MSVSIDLESSFLVEILSSEDIPIKRVVDRTPYSAARTYPSCGCCYGSSHDLIADAGVEGRYWRRCRWCRKMASEPFFPRVFA